MNLSGVGFVSFFRKNNKVLLNIENLSIFEKQFVLSVCLEDVLKNIEVIQLQPFIIDKNQRIVCENALIKQQISACVI